MTGICPGPDVQKDSLGASWLTAGPWLTSVWPRWVHTGSRVERASQSAGSFVPGRLRAQVSFFSPATLWLALLRYQKPRPPRYTRLTLTHGQQHVDALPLPSLTTRSLSICSLPFPYLPIPYHYREDSLSSSFDPARTRRSSSFFFLLPSSFFLLPSSFFHLSSSFFLLLPSSFFLLLKMQTLRKVSFTAILTVRARGYR